MESHPQLDLAGGAAAPRLILIFMLIFLPARAWAQSAAPAADKTTEVKKLYEAGRWNDVVQAVPESVDVPADLELYRGLALAKLQRWDDANKTLQAGLAHHPRDTRFLVELAGVAFRQKRFPAAKRYLRHALSIDPRDTYADNFLASIYFLDGNLEAALKYWNRAGKPKLADLSYSPQPPLHPLILDRVFAFSPGGVWSRDQFLTTQARLSALDLFSSSHYDLQAQPGDSYDLVFRNAERSTWGRNPIVGLLFLLRGLPIETVYPQFYDLGHSGVNWLSLLRWNDQMRRLSTDLSAPLFENPAIRYRFYFDARDENWNVTNTIIPAAPSPARFNMERAVAGAEIRFIESGRWQWNAGVEYSDREFRTLTGIPAQAAPFFTGGSSIALLSGVQRSLIRVPEHRLTLDGSATGEFGTFFADPLGRYGRLQSGLAADWYPLARSDDYHLQARLRAGVTFGKVPFDDLFVLGFDRDSDLWLRGRPTLHNGQKGDAPLGRNYILSNWDFDKSAYEDSFFSATIGPFLDTGNVYDPSGLFGSPKWQWDSGLQTKIRVLGSAEITLGYGFDLRTGHGSFFATFTR
jgi:tetratricopeptide (TPR) repeat protein